MDVGTTLDRHWFSETEKHVL